MTSRESHSGPPSLAADGRDYEEWKKLVKMWARFTKYEKVKQASVIAVQSLQGEARSIALAMEDSEIEHDEGVSKLLENLDKLYLKDLKLFGVLLSLLIIVQYRQHTLAR